MQTNIFEWYIDASRADVDMSANGKSFAPDRFALHSESAHESLPMAKHAIREELVGILSFIAIIWCVFVFRKALPIQIESFGITPRTLRGLVGIPAAPFLHANLEHLTSNTI